MIGIDNCRDCGTPIMKRRVQFGRAGQVEMLICECGAARMEAKYKSSTFEKTEPEKKAKR